MPDTTLNRALRLAFGALVAGSAVLAASRPASASPPTVSIAPATADSAAGPSSGPFGFVGNLERSNYMLGDLFGLRPFLANYGITLGLEETSEVLGNVTGGTHRGADYDGLTQMILQLDTQRAFGWHGGLFNVSALQIHGRNLSSDNLQSLQTASGIEADRATRLWELWYQQKFLDEDRLDVRIGQQSLDQEFMVSQNASYFVNTMFGWPLVPSVDLPGGGPAYPLSALGVRVRARPIDALTMLVGVFNGSPVDVNAGGDPQRANPSGTSFPLNGGVLAIAELQWAYPSLGAMVGSEGEALSRLYKIGFWYDTDTFADQRFDNTGLSLANPASNGTPLTHRGDYAIYGVADQMVWRDGREPEKNVNVFVRAMGMPLPNRNLIDFSLNAGVTMHEPLPHRDDDVFGIGMGYGNVSRVASALDRDTGVYNGSAYPVRGGETFVEVTYQYQATPWLQLQPDFQYVFHPGGGLANPFTGTRIRNEAVFGLRTNILL